MTKLFVYNETGRVFTLREVYFDKGRLEVEVVGLGPHQGLDFAFKLRFVARYAAQFVDQQAADVGVFGAGG